MTMVDFIIIAVFFLIVSLGHAGISSFTLCILFACLAVGRLLRGERL